MSRAPAVRLPLIERLEKRAELAAATPIQLPPEPNVRRQRAGAKCLPNLRYCLKNAPSVPKKLRTLALVILLFTVIVCLLRLLALDVMMPPHLRRGMPNFRFSGLNGTIIVITTTNELPNKITSLTKLSQTLSRVSDLHWFLVEEGNQTTYEVERTLRRSYKPSVHLSAVVDNPVRSKNGTGWAQRNCALEYVRQNYRSYGRAAVVYFADADHTYDIRLFDKYIRHVKSIGVWTVGGTSVTPSGVANNTTALDKNMPTDMAGIAFNLHEILSSNATFSPTCEEKRTVVSCFLAQFPHNEEKIQTFGDGSEVLVWRGNQRNKRLAI